MRVRTIAMPSRVLKRWDAIAAAQLCDAAARLAHENDALRRDLTEASDRAEHCHGVAIGLDADGDSATAEGIAMGVLA